MGGAHRVPGPSTATPADVNRCQVSTSDNAVCSSSRHPDRNSDIVSTPPTSLGQEDYNKTNIQTVATSLQPEKGPTQLCLNTVVKAFTATALTTTDHSDLSDLITVLGTAIFRIKDRSGNYVGPVRAMCDSGSQVNLITEECVQRLKLPRKPESATIIGAGIGSNIVASGNINAQIAHRTETGAVASARFSIISKITCHHPQQLIEIELEQHVPQYQLADPQFGVPGRVDALIGAGTWATLMRNGLHRIHEKGCNLTAQNSAFGWVISGEIEGTPLSSSLSCHIASTGDSFELDLRQFWEINDNEDDSILTPEQQLVEDNFASTYKRDPSGRFHVTIPIKIDAPPLGRSRRVALERFLALEAKMERRPDLAIKCREYMNDYIGSGDMILAQRAPSDPSKAYYIPYHMIHDKKFRVVFDGSRPSSTGVSFNDQQLPGAKLQADLGETLIRFRMHQFGLTADICKMFRQVKVDSSQWNFQRILWRDAPDQSIKEYVITCVVWGFTSATFNAIRAMRQCAVDAAESHPLASRAALSDFYVDDFLSGAESFEALVTLRNQVTSMLQSGGFPIAKWTTSHPRLAQELRQPLQQSVELQMISGVLGMVCCPSSDILQIKVSPYSDATAERLTKKQVVSRISKLYDPSGLYAPAILPGKIIIQDLWRLKRKIDWKDEVPIDITKRWEAFHADVLNLKDVPIPRWNGFTSSATCQWHVFCDASEYAYGACIYLRVATSDGQVSSRLISSKTRVAPIKTQTIPRLELLGAVTATELWQYVTKACNLASNTPVFFWTDSMIVLHWMRKDPRSLKQFVANRVSLIKRSTTTAQWNHVPGVENPADMLSRGVSAARLATSSRWWEGPAWLARDQSEWPPPAIVQLTYDELRIEQTEAKASFVGTIWTQAKPWLKVNTADKKSQTLLERASTLHKLIRATAFAFRFIDLTRNRHQGPMKSLATFEDVLPITVELRQSAIDYWIRTEQKAFFRAEWKALHSQLHSHSPIPSSSLLATLCPFLGSDQIIRVGGRLQNSMLPEQVKHPIIIPDSSRLALLIARDIHIRVARHAGVQLTMTVIRQQYWIPKLRVLVRKIVGQCTSCIRYRKEVANQLMASLPTVRVTPAQPFMFSGVDFAGPFLIRRFPGRPLRSHSNVEEKVWIAVFVCMVTHAIHLDLTHGLAVEDFMETFARFTARRGACKELWSDNGTTFVGTDNELKRVIAGWNANSRTNS